MMETKKRSNIVEWAMRYHQIVLMITTVLIVFGIVGLYKINKNEFPQVTIRQGVVVAVYPGVSALDIEQQLTKPLEEYVFSYKEVNKQKTRSYSRNSICIVQIELNDDVQDKDAFWSKFKHGVAAFKASLPSGVLAVQVNDDFGDSSAMLITMESDDKTYRELSDYMDDLQDRLRTVESVGRMTVIGGQQEQIAVYVDYDRLAQYGISDKMIAMTLMGKDFTTTAGTLKNGRYDSPIYVARPLNLVADVEETIVWSDPRGTTVRLKDVATVRHEYPKLSSYVTNNGVKCLVLSVEIKPGRSITDMGAEVYRQLDSFEQTLPQSVKLFRITDQAKVVKDSVVDFLEELLIAVIAVIVVVLLLMPMRVALVAASTIPISIFISLGLFFTFHIELNTVTLAALIVTLGMIVDNSIVIIDSYMELIGNGMDRRQASVQAATHFFKSILTATLAISITFFPFLIVTSGSINDALQSFPWAVSIVLFVSLIVAELIVPYLQYHFIKEPAGKAADGKKKFSFLDTMQQAYNRLADRCFSHPRTVIACALGSVVLAAVIMGLLPQRLMPQAERNQFAVEIYMPTGTSLDKTVALADSLEHILKQDPRIVSIASFKGLSSPRFHVVYAPQFAGPNYAQFIVNTVSSKATVELLDEYKPKYEEAFPEAYVRFKQLTYGSEANPVELRLTGTDWPLLKAATDSMTQVLRNQPDLKLVRNDMLEPLLATEIRLNAEQAGRMGISNATTELAMMMRYNADGLPIATVWQDDYPINIMLKGTKAQMNSRQQLGDEMIAAEGGLRQVPLRQVAQVMPVWQDGQIGHRNGLRTTTIMAEVRGGKNVTKVSTDLQKRLGNIQLPEGITMAWGGEIAENADNMPMLVNALIIAVVIIFFLLVYHYKRISMALLLMASLLLCFFGTAVDILVQGELTMTCFLGFISLMGILVRNAIIMYDYADELRAQGQGREAIIHAAKRRMRPIFLTSAAASMGVLPMVIKGSLFWGPMGNVIFFGTLITMVFILTVMPVAYMMVGTTPQGENRKESTMKQKTLILVIALGCSQWASAQRVLTLDDCRRMALENNTTLRTAQGNLRSAEEQRKEAFTNYFPQLSATGFAFNANKDMAKMDVSTADMFSSVPQEMLAVIPQEMLGLIPSNFSMGMMKNGIVGSVSAIQPVFAGGQIVNGNRLAKIGVEAGQLQVERAENEVTLTTEQYFWQVVSLKEKLRTLDAVSEMLLRLEKDVQGAVDAGLTTRNDLLQVQLKVNEIESNRLSAENGLRLCRQLLAQHIGCNGEDIDVAAEVNPDVELPAGLKQDHQTSLAATPEYQLLQKNVDASELQRKMAIGKQLPTVAVGAGYTYNDLMDEGRDFGMIFATVSVPISGWWGGSHAIRRQKIATENAREQMESNAQLLVIGMDNAWNEVETSYRQLALARKGIEQADENLRLNRNYYQAGTSTMSDLLQAQQQYQLTRDQMTDAYIAYQTALTKYRQATATK